MAAVTGFKATFSGTLESALQEAFINEEQFAYLQALTPEELGIPAQTWEAITHIEIFESAPQGTT